MAKSTRANKAGSCAYKMRLSETPWALPQEPCQSLQGAGAENTHPKHILELSLSWSAHWRQALLTPGPAEVKIRVSTAALGPQEPGKDRVYFLLIIQKDIAFYCMLLPLRREGTTMRNLFSHNFHLTNTFLWIVSSLTWKLNLLRFYIWF